MSNNETTWAIYGKKLDNPSVSQLIEIRESDRVVGRGEGHGPYGFAIDARLAIQLIRDLWKKVHAEGVFEVARDMKSEVRKIQFIDERAAPLVKNVEALADKAQHWLNDLLHRSFALTVEKGLLLKMLSQPGCEGVRLYLCLNKEYGQQDHLSVVSVGVDIDGKDLNFCYDAERHDTESIPYVENDSFTKEYAYGPNKNPFDAGTTDEEIEPYVLFKYANDKFRYPRVES